MEKEKTANAGHALGPWAIGYGGMEGDDYAVITSPFRARAICNLEPRDYEQANARLIAAAPDLLTACKTILVSLEWEAKRSGITYNGHESLRAAIAKAEGRE